MAMNISVPNEFLWSKKQFSNIWSSSSPPFIFQNLQLSHKKHLYHYQRFLSDMIIERSTTKKLNISETLANKCWP